MDVRQLELFVAVVEEGSIHGGARRLMIAQPAVSKALRKLEHHLAAELVVRSPTGIGLTPAGEVLLAHARDIVHRLDRVADAVGAAGRGERSVRVGLIAGSVAAAGLTSEILRSFTRKAPWVSLAVRELTFADQFSAVESGEVDVAIVRPPYFGDRLDLTVMFEEPMVLCCRADHRLARQDRIPIEDVLDEPMVDMADAPRSWTGFWHLEERRNGPARRSGDSARTLSELQHALLWGSNVIPLAQSAWHLAMADRSLRVVPLEDAPASQIAVATSEDEQRDEIALFVEAARTVSAALVDTVQGARLLA
jgi:DNA-binding transcriptional LysR family regulator